MYEDGASASDEDLFMRMYVATIWSSTPSRVYLNSEIHFRAHINPFSIITIIKLLINIMIMNLLRFNVHMHDAWCIYSFSTRFLVISIWSWNLRDISARCIWWHQLTLLITTALGQRCYDKWFIELNMDDSLRRLVVNPNNISADGRNRKCKRNSR